MGNQKQLKINNKTASIIHENMYTYQTISKNSVSRKTITSSISCTVSKPNYSSTTTYIPSHITYYNVPTKYTYNNYKSVSPRNNVEYYSSPPKYVTSNIQTVYSKTPIYKSHYYPLKFSDFQSSKPNIRVSVKNNSHIENIDNLSQIYNESSIKNLETLENSCSYDYLLPKLKAYDYEGEQKKLDNHTKNNQDDINFETATKNAFFK